MKIQRVILLTKIVYNMIYLAHAETFYPRNSNFLSVPFFFQSMEVNLPMNNNPVAVSCILSLKFLCFIIVALNLVA